MLKVVDINEGLDRRKTTPADVLDALKGAIERGVAQVVVVCEDTDNELFLSMTDMTNTEMLGLLEIAKANYIHAFQHNVSQADQEID